MYIPGIPAHVVQRGNNREPCFFSDDDYRYYRQCLEKGLKRYRVQCHAYCLMTNHVHLLLTPSDETGISRMMALLGKNYVMYINKTYRRTGTLWEGRHKSSLIDADNYLLRCYRYIEMNPVRAGMVRKPDNYAWSSYGSHAWGRADDLISDHSLYHALGKTSTARCKAYRELFTVNLSDDDVHQISHAWDCNYPLGNDRFKESIEKTLQRQIGYAQRGRPKLLIG
ncbi:MAG: transposase [Proteobacteria bacterium]|nr:transposase [Pseudomonadota bacterium]